MMLRLARHNVGSNRSLFAGSFVALALGVTLLSLSVILIWSVEEYAATVDPANTELLLALDDLMAMLGVVSGFSCFMAIFIVASTFGFAVSARQRELGLLRLVGATPRQVRRTVLGESLVVGVVASAFGGVIGLLLAPVALWALNRRGLAPDSIPLADPVAPLLIASGIGLFVALLGARAAARRAAKVTPTDALREAAVERRRIGPIRFLAGVACLAGAVAMLLGIRAASAELALALSIFVPEVAVVGLVCLGPVLVPSLVGLLSLPLRGNLMVALARENLVATPRRTTSLAAPILAISAIAGSLILSLSFAADWDNAVTRQQLAAPVVVSDASPAEGRRVAGRDDVAVADNGLLVQVEMQRGGEGETETFEGVDPTTAAAGRGTREHAGDLDALVGNTMAIARSVAWDHGIHLGDRVAVRFPDGHRARLEVVAEVEDAYRLQQGFLLPRALAARHGGQPSDLWFVVPDSSTAPAELVDALAADLDSGGAQSAEAQSAEAWVAAKDRETRADNQLSLVLVLGPAAVYAAIGIANTLLMGSLRRRHEFIATRLIGATEQQVRRLVVTETMLVAGTALLLGGLITVGVGMLLRAPMTAGLQDVAFTVPWLSLAAVAAACVLIPVVAAVAPARAVLRQASPSRAATA